jgi:hypothetical protein
VMYGKAGNAHTKVELLKGLHTLKHRVTALEQYVAQQRAANENVENLLDAEKESRWDCFFVIFVIFVIFVFLALVVIFIPKLFISYLRLSVLFQGLGKGSS